MIFYRIFAAICCVLVLLLRYRHQIPWNEKAGWGQFMPFVRYQKFDSDATTTAFVNGETKKYEIGTNYVMEPYNALITAAISKTKVSDADSNNAINIALQFQF